MPSYAIIGTSRGIGLSFVKVLGENPANIVFALVRNPGAAQQLNDFVATHKHKNVHIVQADMDDLKSIQNAAETVRKVTDGKLDVLINNGALTKQERASVALGAYEDPNLLEEDMTTFFKTNVVGVIHTINSFLPLLRAGEMKKCIITSSTMGSVRFILHNNMTFGPGYSMSKAAMNVAAAKFAVQYRDEGVVFLSINPGFVKTLVGQEAEAFYEKMEKQIRVKNPRFEGAITPEQCVRDQLDLIHRVTIQQTGSFVNRDGSDGETVWL